MQRPAPKRGACVNRAWLANFWSSVWAVKGSNFRPSACKADALPAELTARGDYLCNVGGGRPRQDEALREVGHDGVLDLTHHRPAAELDGHGSDALIGDAARQDVRKEAEIGGHIERESMGGHTLGDLDADRRNLAVFDPDAGIAAQPIGRNPKIGQRFDQAVFQTPELVADVRPRPQSKDRIANTLPG